MLSRWAIMMTVRPLQNLGHVALDDRFRLIVQGARCFVKDKNTRVGHQCAAMAMLPLPARERAAMFPDDRIVSLRKFGNELGRRRVWRHA